MDSQNASYLASGLKGLSEIMLVEFALMFPEAVRESGDAKAYLLECHTIINAELNSRGIDMRVQPKKTVKFDMREFEVVAVGTGKNLAYQYESELKEGNFNYAINNWGDRYCVCLRGTGSEHYVELNCNVVCVNGGEVMVVN